MLLTFLAVDVVTAAAALVAAAVVVVWYVEISKQLKILIYLNKTNLHACVQYNNNSFDICKVSLEPVFISTLAKVTTMNYTYTPLCKVKRIEFDFDLRIRNCFLCFGLCAFWLHLESYNTTIKVTLYILYRPII